MEHQWAEIEIPVHLHIYLRLSVYLSIYPERNVKQQSGGEQRRPWKAWEKINPRTSPARFQ